MGDPAARWRREKYTPDIQVHYEFASNYGSPQKFVNVKPFGELVDVRDAIAKATGRACDPKILKWESDRSIIWSKTFSMKQYPTGRLILAENQPASVDLKVKYNFPGASTEPLSERVQVSLDTTIGEVMDQLSHGCSEHGACGAKLGDDILDPDERFTDHYSGTELLEISELVKLDLKVLATAPLGRTITQFHPELELRELLVWDLKTALWNAKILCDRDPPLVQLFFRDDGSSFPDTTPVRKCAAGKPMILYAFVGNADDTLWVDSDVEGILGFPASDLPDPEGDNEFMGLCRYLRARGFGSDALIPRFEAEGVRYQPFVRSLKGLISGRAVSSRDLLIIREVLRIIVNEGTDRNIAECLRGVGNHLFNAILRTEGISGTPLDPAEEETATLRGALTIGKGGRLFRPDAIREGINEVERPMDFSHLRQVTILLIDQSGTMCSVVPDIPIPLADRKTCLAGELANAFIGSLQKYQTQAFFGVLSFPDGKGTWQLLPKKIDSISAKGIGDVCAAIDAAAKMLEKLTGASEMRKRILLIADGEDAPLQRLATCQQLVANRIRLDCCLLPSRREKEELRRLIPLCHLTNGKIFVANAPVDNILKLISREAFVDLELAEAPGPPPEEGRELIEDDLEEYENDDFDTDVAMQYDYKRVLRDEITPTHSGTYRNARIAMEFRECWENYHVFTDHDRSDIWRLFVRTKASEPGPFWDLLITFPDHYPWRPPAFRFLTMPDKLYSEMDGRVDLRDYTPATKVVELIQRVGELPLGHCDGQEQERKPLVRIWQIKRLNWNNPRPCRYIP
jgi:hypothetical protein